MQTTSSFYVLFSGYILNINFDGFTFFYYYSNIDVFLIDVFLTTIATLMFALVIYFLFSISKALSIPLDELFFCSFLEN